MSSQQITKLESGFVSCRDLESVTEFNPKTDCEGFYAIPSAGEGVIGIYRSFRDMENEVPNIIVRKSVYKKLCDADRALKLLPGYEDCQLVVTYGYRSPKVQAEAYARQLDIEQRAHPGVSSLALREAVHRVIAYPAVAGHPTGGAVDVIIYDIQRRKFLDFGSDLSDASTLAYYEAAGISTAARAHRKTLREVLCAQGFVPYDGEWWHFSYGDREWAYYLHRHAQLTGGAPVEMRALYNQKTTDEISEISYDDKFTVKSAQDQPERQLRVRLAIQKEGRLTDETLAILKRSGISVTKDTRGFLAVSDNFPLEVLFVRDDDISNLVDAGVADLGIVGENVYWENASKSLRKRFLGFGKCFLALAVPKNSGIHTLEDLNGKRVATSYRRLTTQFLKDKGVTDAKIIDIAGSVEIAPIIDYADAIVDLVSTGGSLKQNNLEVFCVIRKSQSMLIANRNAEKNPEKKAIIDSLVERFDSYLSAKQFKRITMDVPRDRLDAVCAILSEMNQLKKPEDAPHETDPQPPAERHPLTTGAPAVLPVYGFDDWCSLQAVTQLSALWKKTEALKKNGVTNIVFYDIEGIIR